MSEPIRILQIVTQMNRAGMENRLMDIYRNIDRSKVQFDLLTCRKKAGYFDPEIESMGGKIYYTDPLNIRYFFAIPKRFRRFFLDHPEYRIVHCHLNQWCSPVLKGAKQAKVPVRIAHSRTSLEKTTLYNCVKNIVKLGVNRYATHRFAVSQKAGRWLFGKKATKQGAVMILPNAIDCTKFRFDSQQRGSMRQHLGLDGQTVVAHIGNIRSEKNHSYLLKMFAELKKSRPHVRLMIVGADYMNGAVQNEAEQLGISSDVMFLGARSDIPELLQAADVFVFPSFYEGFPGAVLEAEAAALPCIISDTVTDEVCLTENIVRMSIKLPPSEWAKKILEYSDMPRKDQTKEICERDYDIHRLVERLEKFYTEQNNHIKETDV